MFNSYREIIETFPSRKALAERMATVNAEQTQKWHERNFIPPENWSRLADVMFPARPMRQFQPLRCLADLAAQRLAA